MGFMDTIRERFGNRNKGADMARQHSDKVDQGIDRTGEALDDRTGGKHGDRIRTGTDRAKDAMGRHTDEDGK